MDLLLMPNAWKLCCLRGLSEFSCKRCTGCGFPFRTDREGV